MNTCFSINTSRRFDRLEVSTNPHMENTRSPEVEISGTEIQQQWWFGAYWRSSLWMDLGLTFQVDNQ